MAKIVQNMKIKNKRNKLNIDNIKENIKKKEDN